MKALILTFALTVIVLGSGAYALVHALDSAVATVTAPQNQPHQVDPQVAKILALM